MNLILASASPRRKELLSSAGFSYEVHPAEIDEKIPDGTKSDEVAEILARQKAEAVLEKYPASVVLGSDTVVVLDGKILGKPHSEREAFKMLRSLSGKEHSVCTGVCVCSSEKTLSFTSRARVKFFELSDNVIRAYISTGEPMDKAGAYGAQGIGSMLVEKIDGDFFTVMGLPIAQSARLLAQFDVQGTLPF